MPRLEVDARARIDDALDRAGWLVQDVASADVLAGPGVALREFPLRAGHGFADYLLYVDGKAAGVIEAKKDGMTLTGVETQATKYSEGLPTGLPAHHRPLPFLYQATGKETRFTNRLDPEPRSRRVFTFHRPATLARWLAEFPSTLRKRLRHAEPLDGRGLWPAQIRAIHSLEGSFAGDRPRALIQMATGSGKTYTAVAAIYRLIKHADVPRILFLVDRGNLGRQALDEFHRFAIPGDGRKFTQIYNVQHLDSNHIDPVARVCITTIQRLYSMLKGEELAPEFEEGSQFDTLSDLIRTHVPVEYNPAIPVETFNVIFVDECHRSIYTLWRQVLDYFDATIVGLTATPSKQTLGFFHQNLVTEYKHEEAVADGVNVDFDIYKIRTEITDRGSRVEAGHYVETRDRQTRALRWGRLDDDLVYDARALDREFVAVDQIRTVIQTFRDRLFTEIFPGRSEVPKTLIFAKTDSHADDIVQIVREEFDRGNDFCVKITCKTTGIKPEVLLKSFQISPYPRIAVTVDMIAAGTDIKPLEIVMFMRLVKSRNYFEQMKGRGVRVIPWPDFQAVTPYATENKDRFVIVDCVGQCEQGLVDTVPIERNPTVAIDKLLHTIGFGGIEPDILSSMASRLVRLERRLASAEREELAATARGQSLGSIAAGLLAALDPDRHVEAARAAEGLAPDALPTPEQTARASERLRSEAAAPLAGNSALRKQLIEVTQRHDQVIDAISQDRVIQAGYSTDPRDRALGLVASFEAYLRDHKDEITALQVLYSRPHALRLRLADVKALAAAIRAPLRLPGDDPDGSLGPLWRAYEALEASRVRGASAHRLWTDIISLVRHALGHEADLAPYPERVAARFTAWLAAQEAAGRRFTPEQADWLALIRDHIAANLAIDLEDFDMVPFNQRGGLGKVDALFGEALGPLLEELVEVLAA